LSPDQTGPGLLEPAAVHLDRWATDRDDAIRQCGEVLVAIGAVEAAYVDAMLLREQSISTYIGEEVAIPHGTLAGKEAVHRDALAVLRFPQGVDWGGSKVTVCIAIAAQGESHVPILGQLAEVLMDPDAAARLRATDDVDDVIRLLQPDSEEQDA
jgi:PTS system mannitol-specific IIA component